MTSRSKNYNPKMYEKFSQYFFFAVVGSGFFGAHTPHTVDEEKQTKNISVSLESQENILKRFYFIKYTFGGRRKKKQDQFLKCATSTRNIFSCSHNFIPLAMRFCYDVIKFNSQNSRTLSWVSKIYSHNSLKLKKVMNEFFSVTQFEEKRATTCDYFFIVGVRPYRFHKKKRRAVLCT